jgi:hypothetical protein
MTSTKDLVSLGTPWPLAIAEGYSNIAITAAGSTSVDATVCDNQNDVLVLTATGADGIRMNASWPLLQPIFVCNTSGSNGIVYPNTGGAINGGSTDAGITVGTKKSQLMMRITTNVWLSILSA